MLGHAVSAGDVEKRCGDDGDDGDAGDPLFVRADGVTRVCPFHHLVEERCARWAHVGVTSSSPVPWVVSILPICPVANLEISFALCLVHAFVQVSSDASIVAAAFVLLVRSVDRWQWLLCFAWTCSI